MTTFSGKSFSVLIRKFRSSRKAEQSLRDNLNLSNVPSVTQCHIYVSIGS